MITKLAKRLKFFALPLPILLLHPCEILESRLEYELKVLESASSADLLLNPDVVMELLEEGEDCEVLLFFSFRDLAN